MNRKNLTAAVLAGLAGAAGIAGTAQAVNMNPDGLGQVLIYPYYTTNDGNQTILSVVNTTDSAKAVKIRFLEGYNSREVLDFNLYLSHHDVWVAALADSSFFGAAPGVPHINIVDDSCTVPYLYESASTAPGLQAFLDIAYKDNGPGFNYDDGGPQGIARAAEGHFQIIEMGTLVGDFADYATHQLTPEMKDKDDNVTRPATWEPMDCERLVESWTRDLNGDPLSEDDWTFDPTIDMERNSGGLFGGAAIVNPENGTMYSYNAQAIQGFDKNMDGNTLHEEPGTTDPSLNSGDQFTAWVFFGVPQNRAVPLQYLRGVDAVSALFMHENLMNEYTTNAEIDAATEWVISFPTKHFYVDVPRLDDITISAWIPTVSDPGCGGWVPGFAFPTTKPVTGEPIDGPGPWPNPGWEDCTYTFDSDFDTADADEASPPFTELFDGESCDDVTLKTWDRDERTFLADTPTGVIPPVVSPSLPCIGDDCETSETPFQLCYEVNVLRFGEESIFGTPTLDEQSLLLSVQDEFTEGWGRINFYSDSDHVDFANLVGLPATGFAAYEFENEFLGGGDIKAFYGGLFGHKGNVRRICDDQICGSFINR